MRAHIFVNSTVLMYFPLSLCRLFQNAFKLKNTPEGTVKSRPKARRLLGMASRRFASPDSVSPSADKENSVGCSPRSLSPLKVCFINLFTKCTSKSIVDCIFMTQFLASERCCTNFTRA